MPGSSGLDRRRKCIEQFHHFMKPDRVPLYDLHRFQLFESCFFRELIIAFIPVAFQMPRICYIPHITDLVTQVSKMTVDNIKRNESAAIAEMNITVYGRSANIQAHMMWCKRFENFLLPG